MEQEQPKKAPATRLSVLYNYVEKTYLTAPAEDAADEPTERLRFDLISRKVQICEQGIWRDIADADINGIALDASEKTGMSVRPQEVLVVLNSDRIRRVHPLRDYIARQAPYDPAREEDWIDTMANQVHLTHEDQRPLWLRCFRKWFVAMVAGWTRDGAVNQQVLVLIGRQGIYKTTWLEHLVPESLRAYTCKMPNTKWEKDDRLRLAEFGLINLDEIDAMTGREVNSLKSIITATDVNERRAFGYTKERCLRLASFCASGNKREFLTDLTGNRRWLPFEVDTIDSPFEDRFFPIGRLYAQAVYLLEHHYEYWFNTDEIEEIDAHDDAFRAQTNEEELLSVLFDQPAAGKGEFLTTAEISDILIREGSIRRPIELQRLGLLLRRAGYKSKRTRGGQRGWLVYLLPRDQRQINQRAAAREEEIPCEEQSDDTQAEETPCGNIQERTLFDDKQEENTLCDNKQGEIVFDNKQEDTLCDNKQGEIVFDNKQENTLCEIQ